MIVWSLKCHLGDLGVKEWTLLPYHHGRRDVTCQLFLSYTFREISCFGVVRFLVVVLRERATVPVEGREPKKKRERDRS